MFDTGSVAGTSIKLFRESIAALGGARNPHVRRVYSGFCAPSALHLTRSRHFLEVPLRYGWGSVVVFLAFFGFTVAVAFHAVGVVVDAFFAVLADDAGFGVFVTVVTCVFFVVRWIGVTGVTAGTVFAVDGEVAAVVECCWFPAVGCVAFGAVAVCGAV